MRLAALFSWKSQKRASQNTQPARSEENKDEDC